MKNEAYFEWLKKAQEDELSTKVIIDEKGAPSTACFLSQQMAEKCLKALVIYHGKHFLKVHDLLQLESLLLNCEPEIKKIHQEAKKLNRLYIETRYPGDYPEFTWKDAKESFEAAAKIKNFVLSKIK